MAWEPWLQVTTIETETSSEELQTLLPKEINSSKENEKEDKVKLNEASEKNSV